MNPQVLIVGAGPVGLTMAAELARYGVAVRIVDRAAARSSTSKALVLWSRTLELLDRAGAGAAFVAAGHKVSAVDIVAAGRQIGHVTFDGVSSPHPYALMLAQSETERLLEEHLGSLGVTVEREIELLRFEQSDTAVESVLRHADGREDPCTTAWLVGCDGAHSTVRHGLGLTFLGDTLQSDWILADLHLAGLPGPDSALDLFWHRDGMLALFPITPGRYRVIADLGPVEGSGSRADPTLAEVQALLDGRGPGGVTASDPVWLSSFRINERKVADYRVGRVFVAGDAAHVHSPAGGQGMNTGMQDAMNLAWKLALAGRGVGGPGLLDSYSTERSAVGDLVLANAGRLTRLAVMKSPAAQTVRNAVAHLLFGLSPVRRTMAETMTELSIGYPDSPLTHAGHGPRRGPAAGERAPPRPGETSTGAGDRPRFTLCAVESADASVLIARFADLLDPAICPPFAEGGLWLVRPDGYVGLAAGASAWDEATGYLQALS